MDLFPIGMLPPKAGLQYARAGIAASGGAALVGPGQIGILDAGGWWVATLPLARLLQGPKVRLYRALLSRLKGGASEMVIPFVDDPQQPWPGGYSGHRPDPLPFSDGAFFDDGTGFVSASIEFRLVGDAEENATSARLRRIVGGDLRGGEYMTFDHSIAGPRVYLLDGVQRVDGDDDLFDVDFSTCPLRQATPDGAFADFENPRSVMRMMAGSSSPWPAFDRMFQVENAQLMFVESFDYLADLD